MALETDEAFRKKLEETNMTDIKVLRVIFYSPTCLKQASEGYSKCACLRQVLA